jgi:hypothetical protein
MNDDEKRADLLFNLKFWLVVVAVGLLLYEVLG